MRKPIGWVTAIVTLVLAAAPVYAGNGGTAEPFKHPGPGTQHGPNTPAPDEPAPGPLGAPVTVDPSQLTAQVDSTMLQMESLIKQSQALSQSFASLAALHHGADRSEILVMQRVSDAMGAMAGELKMTLEQYKRMLEDETNTETGKMKSEVDGLHAAMEVIAGEVSDAIKTLHRLEGQLGQG